MSDLLPCPFCGCAMRKRQHSAFHPTATVGKPWCWLSTAGEFGGCYELDEGDYAAWNRRTPASTVLPDRAPARDTHTSPNAREEALRIVAFRTKWPHTTHCNAQDAETVALALLSPQGGEREKALEEAEIMRALCCPTGCERPDDCWSQNPRYSNYQERRKQAAAIRSLSTSSGE